jgi:hypothetical protein
MKTDSENSDFGCKKQRCPSQIGPDINIDFMFGQEQEISIASIAHSYV